MSLDAHLEAAVEDDGVVFAFTVENAGDEPVEVTFPNGMTADVAVFADADGGDAARADTAGSETEVWRWSDGRMFTQALRTETLAPGESLTEELAWADPSPGTYTAVGSLAAADADVVERATFVV